jgi:hypothetical protein
MIEPINGEAHLITPFITEIFLVPATVSGTKIEDVVIYVKATTGFEKFNPQIVYVIAVTA